MKIMNIFSKALRTSVETIHLLWSLCITPLRNSWARRTLSTSLTVEELHSTSLQSSLNVGGHEHPLFIGGTSHLPMNYSILAKQKKKTILKNFTTLRSQNSKDYTGTTKCSSKHLLMKDIQSLRYLELLASQERVSHLQLTESENT